MNFHEVRWVIVVELSIFMFKKLIKGLLYLYAAFMFASKNLHIFTNLFQDLYYKQRQSLAGTLSMQDVIYSFLAYR